jgi:hypothetical protein
LKEVLHFVKSKKRSLGEVNALFFSLPSLNYPLCKGRANAPFSLVFFNRQPPTLIFRE